MRFLFDLWQPIDYILWIGSMLIYGIITLAVGGTDIGYLISIMIGITALIYTAKGHIFGPLLMVIFSILYSLISLSFQYHSEFITYGFMTLPMSILAALAWFKHPSKQLKNQVQVRHLDLKGWMFGILLTTMVTIIFGTIMVWLNTKNIIVSTLSISSSFMAVYLIFVRSRYYAIAYAINDFVLVVLWAYAYTVEPEYLMLIVCFVLFFIYDIYGFISWSIMTKNQFSSKPF